MTCATSVPILDFLGLSVLDLGPMYATDRQTSDAHHRLMPLPYGVGHSTTIQRQYQRDGSQKELEANVTEFGTHNYLEAPYDLGSKDVTK